MKGLKYLGIFMFGAVSGAAGMWFGLKKHYEKKAEREVAEARKAFHSLMKCRRVNNDISEEKAESDDSASNSNPDIVHVSKEELYQREKEKKSYFDILEQNEYEVSDDSMPTFEIEKVEFDRTRNNQVYLMWFVEERCMCNANTGRIYVELEDLLGEDGLERLKEASEDDENDKFYIRNDALGVDFCVQLEFQQDYHDIYGDGPEE